MTYFGHNIVFINTMYVAKNIYEKSTTLFIDAKFHFRTPLIIYLYNFIYQYCMFFPQIWVVKKRWQTNACDAAKRSTYFLKRIAYPSEKNTWKPVKPIICAQLLDNVEEAQVRKKQLKLKPTNRSNSNNEDSKIQKAVSKNRKSQQTNEVISKGKTPEKSNAVTPREKMAAKSNRVIPKGKKLQKVNEVTPDKNKSKNSKNLTLNDSKSKVYMTWPKKRTKATPSVIKQMIKKLSDLIEN